MTRKLKFILAIIIVVLFSSQSYADEVDDLLNFYVRKFKPETATLVISEKPDSTGLFQDVYMDLKGVLIENLRMNSLIVRMKFVQFNAPSEWKKGNVECKNAATVLAVATLLESDINKAIADKTFGHGEDRWHDLSMSINPQGLHGKGYYLAKTALINLDILIEIDSKLKILKGKELWLDKPLVKVNRMDLPDYVTKKALSQIQPLVDLRKFPLPLTLHKVETKKGSAILSTKTLPDALKDGLKYSYKKK
ncbi:MAG: DUF2993 domain-containing protein [Synergistaceae bacterium]|nr:DUF2993 domain-containing protein [Synergistaceae bacterium]